MDYRSMLATPNPGRRLVAAMTATISISMENYLETIFHLVREHTVARVKDIADRLKVSQSSVTGMLQSLRDQGLVHYEPYGFVTLTAEGAAVAQRVVRRHETLRDFMIEVLSIDAAEADEAACHMEHGISKQVVDRFLDFAEFMQTCPRAGAKWIHGFGYRCMEAAGSPHDCERCIAQCLESVKEKSRDDTAAAPFPLHALKPGVKGRIVKVGGEGAASRHLRDLGVAVGNLVEVIRTVPPDDVMDVKIKGYHVTLQRHEAADIFVGKIGS